MAPSQQPQQQQPFNCFVPGTASSTTRGIWSDRTLRFSLDKVEARQAVRGCLSDLRHSTSFVFCAVASEAASPREPVACARSQRVHGPVSRFGRGRSPKWISCLSRVMRLALCKSRVDARGLRLRVPEGGAEASVLGTKLPRLCRERWRGALMLLPTWKQACEQTRTFISGVSSWKRQLICPRLYLGERRQSIVPFCR